jgi:hypothetical protein
MAGSISQQAEQRATQIETAHKDIVKAWGDPGTDDYRRNQEMARRALIQSGAKDAFIEAGIIDAQSGMITSAPVAKFLAQVGTKMFAEDSMFSGPASYGKNPFTEKEFNMTEQSMLIKNDPGKAAILIRAAGQKPSDYGMADN